MPPLHYVLNWSVLLWPVMWLRWRGSPSLNAAQDDKIFRLTYTYKNTWTHSELLQNWRLQYLMILHLCGMLTHDCARRRNTEQCLRYRWITLANTKDKPTCKRRRSILHPYWASILPFRPSFRPTDHSYVNSRTMNVWILMKLGKLLGHFTIICRPI